MEHRKVNDTPGPTPIISWCGSSDSRDIILPTYDVTHSILEAMRGVTNDLLSVQGNTGKLRLVLMGKTLKIKMMEGIRKNRCICLINLAFYPRRIHA